MNMKTHTLALLLVLTAVVSGRPQETPKQQKLLKKPRVYNAIVKSDEELIPSQSYPAVAPVIRPFYTGLFPYAPVIIPQVQPYPPLEYGNLKAASDYGEERFPSSVDYPSKELTPPSPNQPRPTYKAPSSEADQELHSEGSLSQTTGGSNGSALGSTMDSPNPLQESSQPSGADGSYFPQKSTKNQQSNDYGSFLQPPSESSSKQSKPSGIAAAQDSSPFQSFFNYQPENADIPNVPPPPLPVKQNDDSSSKKKIDYPNAPPTLFSI